MAAPSHTEPGLVPDVEAFIRQQRLFRKGHRILVAVSGGLDSRVLLDVLIRLARRWRLKLTLAHFDHQLRGRASASDRRFVRSLAGRLGLRCCVGHGDVRGHAGRRGVSLEMAARDLRHRFLAETARRLGIPTIATAHHADDQVELFFLRVLRGTGPDGLGGMKASAPSPAAPSIRLVRPLLGLPKGGLLAHAKAHHLRWREDASNRAVGLSERNRVRQRLLPWLRKEFGRQWEPGVLRLMDLLREETRQLAAEARAWSPSAGESSWRKLPVALQRRVLLRQLVALGVSPEFDLVEQLRRAPGRTVDAPGAVRLRREPSGLLRRVRIPRTAVRVGRKAIRIVRRSGAFGHDGWRFRWERRRVLGPVSWKECKPSGGEILDAGAVGERILVRCWQPGDRYWPSGMPVPVKLQDLFVNAKVPVNLRRRLPVAEDATGRLFWVAGLRVSEPHKVTSATVKTLSWRWTMPPVPAS